jgi:NIMA (never in mitosis gene a)-related kinase
MDRYRRVKVLGRGSYGSAILVRERAGGQQRVIKEIDLSRMPAAAQKEAQSEAGVLRSLSHPYIVGYFDTFVESTKLYIVMEFADGGDLAASIKEHKEQGRHFSENEALQIFTQCCLALQHVHSRHILHRDLKSGNIFLTKTGTVKLGDFGIAKVLDATNAEAQTLVGTPIYLAPEVCDSRPYGIKADIWSIGVVVYELLALAQPFRADNLAALMMRILRHEPDPLPEDLYSKEVCDMVSWMLQKSPEKRPSIEEVLAVNAVSNIAAQLCPSWQPPEPKGKPNCAREPSVGKRPRSGASERSDRPMPPTAPSSAPSACGTPVGRDALDDFLGNKRAVEAAKLKARGGGAAQHLPGSQLSGREPSSSSSAQCRAPSVGDSRSEYFRNRELAAQAKARAEGDMYGAREQRRAQSLDPTIVLKGRRENCDQRNAAEEEHRQQLFEAAAQARRDRREVQQRMQELEQQEERGSRGEQDVKREIGDQIDRAMARRATEDARLQALNEAAAQARRDRKQIQQKMQDLERPRSDLTQRANSRDSAQDNADVSSVGGAAGREQPMSEDQRLKALADAAAEARRDRIQIQQKMQQLERNQGSSSPCDGAEECATAEKAADHTHRAAPSKETKEVAEARHVQALQEAAAQARRDRKQLQMKMQELDKDRSGMDASSGPPHELPLSESGAPRVARNSSREDRSVAQERRDSLQEIVEGGYPPLRELHRLNDTSTSTSPLLNATSKARSNGLGNSGELQGMLGSGRCPLMGSPQRKSSSISDSFQLASASLGGSSELRRLLANSRLSPKLGSASPTGLGSSMEQRARSSDVSIDSTRRRPLGQRSSSLGLAGGLLAGGGVKSRPVVDEVATSAPPTASRASEPQLPPQLGPTEAASPSALGSTWSKNKCDTSGYGASRGLAAATADGSCKGIEKAERIVEGTQPDLCGSTLRLPDSPEPPAEDLLAMKLSRLKSPPPYRASITKAETSKCGIADTQRRLTMSAKASDVVAPLLPSEHTLGSLSYTETCTLSSQMSTVSCIAAK